MLQDTQSSQQSQDRHGAMKRMQIFLCIAVIFGIPFTHTEVWKLILITAVMSVVTQFVEPVVFGCYEEVPGQQGADAHQKEDDVD